MGRLRDLEHGPLGEVSHRVLSRNVLGFASFLEARLAFDGTMNLRRNAPNGSAASNDVAYSLEAAFSGNAGFRPLDWVNMAKVREACEKSVSNQRDTR